MHKNINYPIIDAIADLQSRGFILDFSLVGNKLFCVQEKCYLLPDEVEVIEVHRFLTGKFNSDNAIIVCAIESLNRPLRGILLSSGQGIPGPSNELTFGIRHFDQNFKLSIQ
jgi:hypothetical protein